MGVGFDWSATDPNRRAAGRVVEVSAPDVERFKEVSGHFVTGVVVVTASSTDGLAGFTCQTFGSLSLEPMLISFSASTASTSWPKVRRADSVGINILESRQERLARVFATSGRDKFADLAWSPAPRGAPLIDGALAHLEGSVVDVTAHGDHDLVVVAIDYVRRHDGSPLVYYRGGYGVLA
jgi:3-hydroxy-9,10-secoandrosta-1,3,5(10)-triene-9,17-dione monooxygenase reductase component